MWHWEAPHLEWEPSEPWHQVVSSYAIDDGARLLLFDPIAPPSEIDELVASRETVIVLTAPWHERDTRSFVERLGTPVFVPPPDSQEDLMQTYGVSAEQAAGGSPDVAWLLVRETGEARLYAAGDRLPVATRSTEGSRTTSCCGSRAAARWSPATRSSISAKASRSPPYGFARA